MYWSSLPNRLFFWTENETEPQYKKTTSVLGQKNMLNIIYISNSDKEKSRNYS